MRPSTLEPFDGQIITLFFSLTSLIMRHHRRHAATRPTPEAHDPTSPMRQTPVEQWLEEQNTNTDSEQYAHETWYVINLFHLSAPSVDPAHVAGMAWLWGPDDVMRGMPRAWLWRKLPYKSQPMFLLPNPLWSSLGIERPTRSPHQRSSQSTMALPVFLDQALLPWPAGPYQRDNLSGISFLCFHES